MRGSSGRNGRIRRARISEGIETALSASELFGVPVWSVVAAFNFRNFVPPKSVRRIIIFGDSDKNFIGQG
ncbi:MAG: toprim domain-containing protein, partial [Parasutterella excrementihominis]|uniref:toprim domain-containing protein n=1 Tax=Parasutterella excrementihominis TaxID=487175 RepID=UPI0039A20205